MQQKIKLLLRLLLSLCLVSNLIAQVLDPELDQAFKSLRNRDSDLLYPDRWFDLADRYYLKYQKDQKSELAIQYLYRIAYLYERLARKTKDSKVIYEVQAIYLKIIQEYPGHELAGESLINLANFYDELNLEQEVAARLYLEVIDLYPSTSLKNRANTGLIKLYSDQSKSLPELNSGKLIILDPGHGGDDFGAKYSGVTEKDLTLDLSKILADELRSRGYRVRFTRTSDQFIPLASRSQIANDYDAAAFISLHSNAGKGQSAGFEVYVADPNNLNLAKQLTENQGYHKDIIPDVKIDLAGSNILAEKISIELTAEGKDYGLNACKIKKSPLYVLLGVKMPAVLLELLYLDDPKSNELLKQGNFRQFLALAIADGISNFLN